MRPDKPDELIFELADIDDADRYQYTMEVKLREGVKFHDGTPFTADDVKATYEYGCQPDRPAQWYPGHVEVEVVDDLTCRIKTEKLGYPAALYYYLSSFLPIMSATDVANKAKLSATPNGTGPFKFVEQKGNTTILEPMPTSSWARRRSRASTTSFVGDTTTRTLSLLNGEADIIERLEQEQVETISQGRALRHQQGGVDREQVPVLPLLEGAVRRSARPPRGLPRHRPQAGAARSARRMPGSLVQGAYLAGEVRLYRGAELSGVRSGQVPEACWRRRASPRARACPS